LEELRQFIRTQSWTGVGNGSIDEDVFVGGSRRGDGSFDGRRRKTRVIQRRILPDLYVDLNLSDWRGSSEAYSVGEKVAR